MFELELSNARYWRDCVSSIVSLVDEGIFNISKEGIGLKAMDPSSISMVSFFIPNKAFAKFKIDKDANIGLNLENLSKILSRARDNESLVMKDSGNKVVFEFISQNGSRRYVMQMVEARKGAAKEPSIEFDANIEIGGDALREIIKDASLISSYISLRASKDHFGISARGDSGELEEQHQADGAVTKKVSATKNADSVFNVEFLENMVKSCPAGVPINISLKTNEPLKVSYPIGEAQITYFLAPYIEE